MSKSAAIDRMEDDDIEVDGCQPFSSADNIVARTVTSTSPNSLHLDVKTDEQRLESGFHSLDCDRLLSESNEGRLLSSEENLIPVGIDKRFRKLTIDTDDKNTRHQSLDEGFVSEEPLDLSTRSGQRNAAPEDLDKQSLPTQVDISVYLKHVEETFQQDDDGDTRLHTAIIQLLLEYAFYCISLAPCHQFLNIKNNYQQTALHLAAITKQALLARRLLTSGAQVDARDHNGNTPLHIAAKEGHLDVAKALLEPVRYSETSENNYDIPYQAIPQNLEARNYDGQVCLHLAAESCHIEIIDVLLQKGANINSRDGKSGRTALHYAAESGHLELLRYLLDNPKIDVNALTYSRLTPIMLAKGRGMTEAARLLKEKGALVESEEEDEEDMNDDSYDDYKINGNPVY